MSKTDTFGMMNQPLNSRDAIDWAEVDKARKEANLPTRAEEAAKKEEPPSSKLLEMKD